MLSIGMRSGQHIRRGVVVLIAPVDKPEKPAYQSVQPELSPTEVP